MLQRLRSVRRIAVATGIVAAFGIAAHVGWGAFGPGVGPPTPRISSAPPRTTVARSATFAVDAAPGVTLECGLDKIDFSPCSWRVTYKRLALGDHSFRVRARLATGARSSAASYEWRIVAPRALARRTRAAIVPRPVFTAMPTRPYVSPNGTFAWRVRSGRRWRPGTRFACSLDGRAWARCRTPKTYRDLRSGRHVFRVRAGFRGRLSRANRFHWTIELTLPEAPTITPVDFDPAAPRVTFTFESEGAAGFECRVDGGAWTPCTSPVELDALAPGAHELCVRGITSEGVTGLPSCFSWTREPPPAVSPSPGPSPSPAQFSITGDLPTLLSPGSSGPLPLTVWNPNEFDVLVSQLVVSVEPGSSQAGCDGPANIAVTQSNTAGGAVSILVPAHGSVTLPAQGATAPEVAMLDLPTNQDACKGAVFELSFNGTATKS